jgi:endogenous inhibitor of DNA gyrase (YacG/DUF329 family)
MPNEAAAAPGKCPLCGKPRVQQYRPFCSRGCRDRDLNHWFDERYRTPAHEGPDGGTDDARFEGD